MADMPRLVLVAGNGDSDELGVSKVSQEGNRSALLSWRFSLEMHNITWVARLVRLPRALNESGQIDQSLDILAKGSDQSIDS